jgi:phosphopantetheinyl transferase (holo-ACP synthase)
LDAERIDRFQECCGPEGEPWSRLFTEREVKHNQKLEDPAFGFCASFCIKEAVLKAVGVPIDYQQCELLLCPDEELQNIHLAPEFSDEHGIDGAVARVMQSGESRECVVAVCVYRRCT